LQVFDANGKFVGMAAMLKQVETAFEGLTDKQKQGYLAKLFSAESMQEFNILLAAGSDAVEGWAKKIDASMGEAARVAKEKLDNLAGDARRFTSVLEDQQISFYEKMKSTLRSLVQDATAFIASVDTTELSNSLTGFAQSLFQTGKTLFKVTEFVLKHWRALMAMAKIYVSIKAFMITYNATVRAAILLQQAWTAATQMYASATRGATTATTALNTATKASPWGLLVGAISAAVTAMALFRDTTKEAREEKEALMKFEAEQARGEAKGLREDTESDRIALQSNTLNEAQRQAVSNAAQMRISQLEQIKTDYIAQKKQADEKYAEYEKESDFAKKFVNPFKNERTLGNFLFGNYHAMESANKHATERVLKRSKELSSEWANLWNKMPFHDDKEIDDLIAQNKAMLQPEKTVSTHPTAALQNDTPLSSGEEAAENISRGGASQKIINITVHKFQDDIKVIVNHDDSRGEAAGRDISGQINEQLLRIINSANEIG
jgi:gas vesicle protein